MRACLRDGVGEGDVEVLVPMGVLGVGDDARAGDAGAGEADGDVGVGGDDLVVLLEAAAAAVGAALEGLLEGLEGGEEAAEALDEEVHVGEAPGFDDLEVEVAVEVDHLIAVNIIANAAAAWGFFAHFRWDRRIAGLGRGGEWWLRGVSAVADAGKF